ncbi:hypothetical protein [Bradyrhizobium sp. ERR14]|uniref:hypothetical protein n=1 Tax=Bradyrhizobium sp. ERR14 TaxID=2663837 RepID=UPI0016133486|nr:hypothetical protein [Bradyrhizobium sp. ERR14]MBB4391789.1 hypothetical protein [Bradyrhizobium sp. ERR14]
MGDGAREIKGARKGLPHQLIAIFGWKTAAQAELYTEKARRRQAAAGWRRDGVDQRQRDLVNFD